MSQRPIPNVIVFGETGAGKSSVVNMILGSDKAKVGHGALGETFRSTAFPVEIAGKIYSLHDTVGLGEYSGGTVDSAKAVRNLYRLVTDLSNSGGVNLLVFVIKCGRLTENMHKNYGLFHHVFCDSRVPIVIIITGCENVEPAMDTWWINNESSFTKAGMSFNDHACVCAFRGTKASGYCNMYLVEESVDVVKRLIVENCMPNGWEKPPIAWLQKVIGSMIGLFRSSSAIYTDVYDRLPNVFSSSAVEQVIDAVIRSNRSIPNVVFFSETGVGKSSVINTILGSNRARDDHGDFAPSAVYTGEIHGETYNLYDTVELGVEFGERRGNNVRSARAIGLLYRLVGDLSDAGGINLLVFVIKCGGSIEIMRKQYGLLHHGFCDSKVPIVIVVTGCENVRPNVDTWWINNQSKLTQAGMLFDGHACMSAFTGRNGGYHNKDLVEESVEVVRRLVVQHCMSNSWKMKKQLIDPPEPSMVNLCCLPNKLAVYKSIYDRLRITFSHPEAESIIEAIRKTRK